MNVCHGINEVSDRIALWFGKALGVCVVICVGRVTRGDGGGGEVATPEGVGCLEQNTWMYDTSSGSGLHVSVNEIPSQVKSRAVEAAHAMRETSTNTRDWPPTVRFLRTLSRAQERARIVAACHGMYLP